MKGIAECLKSKKKNIFGVQIKNCVSSIPSVRQNLTVIDYLLATSLVRCNIDLDKVNINIISPSKMAAIFVLLHMSGRGGPPFSNQGQGHIMTLNIFSDKVMVRL